jgi:hypothetical protein
MERELGETLVAIWVTRLSKGGDRFLFRAVGNRDNRALYST